MITLQQKMLFFDEALILQGFIIATYDYRGVYLSSVLTRKTNITH
jgi:hypothetical protein